MERTLEIKEKQSEQEKPNIVIERKMKMPFEYFSFRCPYCHHRSVHRYDDETNDLVWCHICGIQSKVDIGSMELGQQCHCVAKN